MSVMEAPRVVAEDFCLDQGALEERLRKPELSLHEQLAADLGIGQVPRCQPKPMPSAQEAAKLFPEWTGFRLEAWRAFLPTTYRERDWKAYDYVLPDVSVMQSIFRARETGVFERIEFWTDEHNYRVRRFRDLVWDGWDAIVDRFDPVAVGIVDKRVFPIVRWGADELISERTVMRVGGFRAVRARIIGGY